MQECLSNEGAFELESFARSTEASLDLLRAIDGTVESMRVIAELSVALAKVTAHAIERVQNAPVQTGVYLDPDDIAINALERGEDVLNRALARIVLKRSSIDKDDRLEGHHCEALHDAYESAMDAMAILIDEIQTLRDSIIRIDLAAEPRDGVDEYETVADLLTSLREE